MYKQLLGRIHSLNVKFFFPELIHFKRNRMSQHEFCYNLTFAIHSVKFVGHSFSWRVSSYRQRWQIWPILAVLWIVILCICNSTFCVFVFVFVSWHHHSDCNQQNYLTDNSLQIYWVFLDALASLDFKLWVSHSFIFFTASASTGLSELFFVFRTLYFVSCIFYIF